MKPFLIRWASTTFAVMLATAFVPGITADSAWALIWAGLLLGVLNAVVRPVLLLLSLPLIVLTFGLAIPVINAILLHFVGGGWIAGFHVAGFGSALVGAIVISVASWAVSGLFSESRRVEFQVHRSCRPYRPNDPDEAPRPGQMKRVEGRVIENDHDSK